MNASNWLSTTLGEQLTFQRGFDITKKEQGDGNYPVVSSSGPNSTHTKYMVEGPGVVTGRKGTLGTVFYVQSNFWPHDTTLWVKDFHGNDPKYAYFFLKTMGFEQYDCGASNPTLNRNHIHTLPIRYPPLPTQRKIARILSAYDDLIENNTRRIAILEEMAQTIYREWFVHFRFPGHENAKFVDSPLGRIPEGWKKPFAEYVDFLEGPGLRRWQYREEGIPFLNIRTIGNNDIDLSKCQFIDPAEVEQKYSHFLLRPLDHIVSSSGTIGRIATVQQHHLPLMLNTSIIRMAPENKAVGRWQLKHFLQSPYFQDQIVAHASGVAQMNYGPSHLKLMWIVAPDVATGIAYEQHVEPMESLLCSLVKKNTNLRKTRDLLLPKLISGQLDVEQLDIDTGEPTADNPLPTEASFPKVYKPTG